MISIQVISQAVQSRKWEELAHKFDLSSKRNIVGKISRKNYSNVAHAFFIKITTNEVGARYETLNGDLQGPT